MSAKLKSPKSLKGIPELMKIQAKTDARVLNLMRQFNYVTSKVSSLSKIVHKQQQTVKQGKFTLNKGTSPSNIDKLIPKQNQLKALKQKMRDEKAKVKIVETKYSGGKNNFQAQVSGGPMKKDEKIILKKIPGGYSQVDIKKTPIEKVKTIKTFSTSKGPLANLEINARTGSGKKAKIKGWPSLLLKDLSKGLNKAKGPSVVQRKIIIKNPMKIRPPKKGSMPNTQTITVIKPVKTKTPSNRVSSMISSVQKIKPGTTVTVIKRPERKFTWKISKVGKKAKVTPILKPSVKEKEKITVKKIPGGYKKVDITVRKSQPKKVNSQINGVKNKATVKPSVKKKEKITVKKIPGGYKKVDITVSKSPQKKVDSKINMAKTSVKKTEKVTVKKIPGGNKKVDVKKKIKITKPLNKKKT